MKNINILSKIWLSDKEASIYYDLLQNWVSSIVDISNRTNIHRPIIYKTLPYLIELKLVWEITLWKRKKYKAESPEHLQVLFENLSQSFNYILPELNELYETNQIIPNLKVLTGQQGILSIYEDIVSTLWVWEVYYRYSSRTQDIWKDFSKYRQWIRNKKIQRMIITSSEKYNSEEKSAYKEIVWIPKSFDLFEDNISKIIYKNKVAIIDYNSMISYIIENKIFYNFEKKIFLLIFKLLKQKNTGKN